MIQLFQHFLSTYGLEAVVLLIAAEYLGVPLPTELAYIAGSQLVHEGIIPYWILFGAIMVAHFCGSLLAYTVGSRAGERHKAKHFRTLQRRLEGWYKRYGSIIVIVTQLVGHVRPWASYVAGFSKIPRSAFITYSMIGSAMLTYIMLALADTLVSIWQQYPVLRVSLIAIFAIFIALAIITTIKGFFFEKKTA